MRKVRYSFTIMVGCWCRYGHNNLTTGRDGQKTHTFAPIQNNLKSILLIYIL